MNNASQLQVLVSGNVTLLIHPLAYRATWAADRSAQPSSLDTRVEAAKLGDAAMLRAVLAQDTQRATKP
jgi:hypothetical protein